MPESSDQTPTVLLAEDEPVIRAYVGTVLEHQGFIVISACDGAEAIQLSRNSARGIDLLVTDVSMGSGINGFELAERMRSDAPAIRVLIMSGMLDSENLATAKGYPFLPKPFAPNVLIQRVQELLPHLCGASNR